MLLPVRAIDNEREVASQLAEAGRLAIVYVVPP